MMSPEKPRAGKLLSDAEIDSLYGLEPAIDAQSTLVDPASWPEFVAVSCPYCGEGFETSADASGGPCKYVEDCQVCCQPIEMELCVNNDGGFKEMVARRGDGE